MPEHLGIWAIRRAGRGGEGGEERERKGEGRGGADSGEVSIDG